MGCGGVYMNGSIGSDASPDGLGTQDDAGKVGQGSQSGGDATPDGSDPPLDGGGSVTTDSGSAAEASPPEAGVAADAGGGVETGSTESGATGDDASAGSDSSTTAVACPMTSQYAMEANEAIAGGSPIVCPALVCAAGDCCYVQQTPFSVCVAQ